MPMTKRNGRTRVQFDVGPAEFAILKEMKSMVDAAAYATVIRQAIHISAAMMAGEPRVASPASADGKIHHYERITSHG